MTAIDIDLDIGLAIECARVKARFAPHMAEDLESEAMVALCEAAKIYPPDAGFEPFDSFARRSINRHLDSVVAKDKFQHRIEQQAIDHSTIEVATESRSSSRVSVVTKRKMTEGQRRRFRRNLVIAVAHRGGLSQRLLADVFGLPRSSIAVIVGQMNSGRNDGKPDFL